MTVICGCGPAHAAFFSVYEYSKQILNVNNEEINPFLHGLTGATAVLLHDSIMTPFDGSYPLFIL
jgi:solute carrier family 25 iron transporter 28/37